MNEEMSLPVVSPTLPTASAEQRAREFLAAGKFRKARDEFKLLCKQDRAKYLPLLIQANLGLAREMLAHGLASDAQQVLAYLKTIATPADLAGLELETAARVGQFTAVLPQALATLANPPPSLTATAKLQLADQVILAFEPFPTDAITAALVADAQAVQDALQAVATGQFDQAADRVRPIPHGSAFAHWKLFIKGQLAFHRGRFDLARQSFAAVPADSAPGKAGVAYRLWAGEPLSPAGPVATHVLDGIGRLAGQRALGLVLADAERNWRAQQPRQSYEVLRRAVVAFPSENLDLVGALSEFYFQSLLSAPPAVADPLAKCFDAIATQRGGKTPVELKLVWRSLALYFAPISNAVELQADWIGFIREHEKLQGANPRLASVAYEWLGQQLAAVRSAEGPFGFGRPEMRQRQGALDSLRKSVKLDPTNRTAYLTLAAVYERLRLPSDRNKLLDEMTARFPDDKAVLIEAARGCLDRNACQKGLGYLDRVRQLDRLDPAVPDLMVEGLLQQAGQQFKQNRLDTARATFDSIGDLLVDQADNLVRSRWCVLIRQGLLEHCAGQTQRGDELLAAGRAASPAPSAFLWYAHLARLARGRRAPGTSPDFLPEFQRDQIPQATAAGALRLVRIFKHWIKDDPTGQHYDDCQVLTQYIAAAVRRPFTREEARQLIDQLDQAGLRVTCHKEAGKFIRAILKRDPIDPLFRLYDLAGKWDFGSAPARLQRDMHAIIAEAVRRGDHSTAQRAERLWESSQRGPVLPPPPPEVFGDDDFEDPLENDLGGAGFPFESGFDALTANDPLIRNMIKQIAVMTDAELRKFRKQALGDMPEMMFEFLVASARSSARHSTPVSPPLPPPKPPPKPDPKQMNFF